MRQVVATNMPFGARPRRDKLGFSDHPNRSPLSELRQLLRGSVASQVFKLVLGQFTVGNTSTQL